MEPFEKPNLPEPKKEYPLPQKKEMPSVGKTLAQGFFGRSAPKELKEEKASPKSKEDESIYNKRGRASRKDFMKALTAYDRHIDLNKRQRELAAKEVVRGNTIEKQNVKRQIVKLKGEKNPEEGRKIKEEIKLFKKADKL